MHNPGECSYGEKCTVGTVAAMYSAGGAEKKVDVDVSASVYNKMCTLQFAGKKLATAPCELLHGDGVVFQKRVAHNDDCTIELMLRDRDYYRRVEPTSMHGQNVEQASCYAQNLVGGDL